jgi:hypothetical protein
MLRKKSAAAAVASETEGREAYRKTPATAIKAAKQAEKSRSELRLHTCLAQTYNLIMSIPGANTSTCC